MRALLVFALVVFALVGAGCSAGDPADLSNPFDPRNAQADDDGDGVPNGDEITAGGDPRNPDSDGDALLDDTDPCPNAKGDGQCLVQGVCAGARTGCPCADEYPATFDGIEELRCDGLDNDCDGTVDEGDPGGGADCETGAAGVCASGTEHCLEAGIACVADDEAGDEVCDNLDNDCDGSTDEDNPEGGESCDTGQPGECADGTDTCIEGVVACVGDNDVVAESCDGLDNDCDGSTDEEDPGGGGACVTGDPGVCSPGVEHCVQGDILCVANAQAAEEACDTLDNDCDGEVDEDDPRLGDGCQVADALGACAAGEQTCVGGELDCTGPGPEEESCDGVDNDCDGDEDEDDPDSGDQCNSGEEGVCAAGTVHCVAGGVQCVQELQPADGEICDGLDNDCDGSTDEDVPEVGDECDTGELGACAAGLQACDLGELQCERITAPDDDICNGIDDDCDGELDEDDPEVGEGCDTGDEGNCADGFIECVTAEVECEEAGAEGEGEGEGGEVCLQTAVQCVAELEAGEEVCDGEADEDCDGFVDEDCNGCPDGTIVPDGWTCIPGTPAQGFVMGTPADEEGREADEVEHVVHISRPFFMKKLELTRGEWRALTGSAPFIGATCSVDCPSCVGCDMDCLSECREDISSCWEAEGCDACVRECVECRQDCPGGAPHWVDSLKLANLMSARDGLPQCYRLTDETGHPGVNYWLRSYLWSPTFTCEGYRLPTEAEWEWAARAGTTTATYAGDYPDGLVLSAENRCNLYDNLEDIAWYCGNTGQARAVGLKDANRWGLYDMLGSVNEWTWDFHNPYPVGPVTDPLGGAAGNPQEKVVRGGSYFEAWNVARSGNRWKTALSSRFFNFGIRLVRTVPPE